MAAPAPVSPQPAGGALKAPRGTRSAPTALSIKSAPSGPFLGWQTPQGTPTEKRGYRQERAPDRSSSRSGLPIPACQHGSEKQPENPSEMGRKVIEKGAPDKSSWGESKARVSRSTVRCLSVCQILPVWVFISDDAPACRAAGSPLTLRHSLPRFSGGARLSLLSGRLRGSCRRAQRKSLQDQVRRVQFGSTERKPKINQENECQFVIRM
jgi:hypothetical protein